MKKGKYDPTRKRIPGAVWRNGFFEVTRFDRFIGRNRSKGKRLVLK